MLPSEVKIGDYIYMKNKPCKVTEISSGNIFHFSGINIFTRKKHECMYTKNSAINVVERHRFKLIDINPDDTIEVEYDPNTKEILGDVETYGITDDLRADFVEDKTYINILVTNKDEKFIISYEIVQENENLSTID